MRKPITHLIIAIILMITVIFSGTLCYMHLENLNQIDALYFTVMTVSTIGYGDIYPSSDESKIFTIFLVVIGVSIFFYIVGALAVVLIEGELLDIFKLKRMKENIKRMKDHVILCGYGDLGTNITEKLSKVVVIEKDEERFNDFIEKGLVGIHGDSTRTDILEEVEIENARAIIIALNSDPDALYTILTARELNPKIRICARANERESVRRMRRAGADYVICLPGIGSRELIKALEK